MSTHSPVKIMTIRTKKSTSGSNNVYHRESPCDYWLTVSIQRTNDLNREEVICDIQLSTRGVSQRESKQLSFLFAPVKYIWSLITRYLIEKTQRHLWWYVLFSYFLFHWKLLLWVCDILTKLSWDLNIM